MNADCLLFRLICIVTTIVCPLATRCSAADHSPATQTTPATQTLKCTRPIEQKCFPLLSSLADDEKATATLVADSDLQQLEKLKHKAVVDAVARSEGKAQSITAACRWSDDEIKSAGTSLGRSLFKDPTLGGRIARQLRDNGMFIRQQTMPDAELVNYAWEQAARGINHMLDVYGDGKPPQYPKIDSMSFKPDSDEWAKMTRDAAKEMLASSGNGQEQFFTVPMQLALRLMKLSDRDEAGRFEPMATGENKPALDRVPGIDWKKFTCNCILVPGIGPEDSDTALSLGGKTNCELAAAAFHTGAAPFILVSGGYVHPNKTRFCEAIEMRRELIDHLHIPADVILIDPHARHTTTNLRNAARLVYRYGLPMDLPTLVVSNSAQIHNIASADFARRCRRELGYEPARIGRQLTDTSVEIQLNLDSLEADPMSPLDP